MQAGDAAQGRGLPRAIRPEQDRKGPGLDVQIDAPTRAYGYLTSGELGYE